MIFKPGNAIFEAEGDFKLLFKLWRVSQTFLSLMCAIATKTASLVSALKNDLGPTLEEIEVKDVRIGLAYTGVLLSENYGGVACTPFMSFQAVLLLVLWVL